MGKLRGQIAISADDVISRRHCWNDDYIREWAIKTTGSEVIDFADIVNATDMSVVDKLWMAWEFGGLSDLRLHILAVDFARHWLKGDEPTANVLLDSKLDWLDNVISDEKLEHFQDKAWAEAKFFPTVASTAFALAADAFVAVTGASSRAGGWYGGTVNPVEKMWQWQAVLAALRTTYGDLE
jgi:hypothetical protein